MHFTFVSWQSKPVDVRQRPTKGVIVNPIEAGRLHPPPDNVQGIGRRLAKQASYGSKH